MTVPPGADAETALQDRGGAQHVVVSYDEDLRTPILDAALRLLQFWRSFAVLAIFGAAGGIAVSFAMTKQYRIEAQFAFSADENSSGALSGLQSRLGSLASLAGVDLSPPGSSHAEVVAVLKSEAFIRDFIIKQGLMPLLFANEWDTATQKWKDAEDVPSLGEGYRRFMDDVLRVSEDKSTSLLRISAQWSDAGLAKTWIEVLVTKLNESLRLHAMERADQNLKFLREEVEETQTLEISGALFGLIESETRQKMLAKVNTNYALRVVDPPVIPEPNNFAVPNRLLMGIIGGMLGLLCGLGNAALRVVLRGR